jgi:hypothetical protein
MEDSPPLLVKNLISDLEKNLEKTKKELSDSKLEIISLKLRIAQLENSIELPKRIQRIETTENYIPDTLHDK